MKSELVNVLTGDYGAPDCVLKSERQYMTIEMFTDGFTEAPGFRATHIATDAGGNRGSSWQSESVMNTIVLSLMWHHFSKQVQQFCVCVYTQMERNLVCTILY